MLDQSSENFHIASQGHTAFLLRDGPKQPYGIINAYMFTVFTPFAKLANAPNQPNSMRNALDTEFVSLLRALDDFRGLFGRNVFLLTLVTAFLLCELIVESVTFVHGIVAYIRHDMRGDSRVYSGGRR